ncbi:MAG: CDP-alcohol phosphatidyltransferase family protein [Elusimicrobia bacterium]|nr:CDP-alcohol phosphatidyltransferase family protein [Elusimicrobiota bacterium]
MIEPLQVVLGPAWGTPLVASVPAVLRAAQRAAEELSPQGIVISGADGDFARLWGRQIAGLGAQRVECSPEGGAAARLAPGTAVLTLSAQGLPRAGALASFLSRAQATGGPARWLRGGETLATYEPSPGAAGPRAARDLEAAPEEWLAFVEPGAAARAEAELYAGLIKDTDGFIARFDRRISIRISRLLLRTPATPNDITTASLLLGLAGASLLAFGSHPVQVLGAGLLWFCCILDGCDGEVARLKLLCSESGARYDLQADHIAHLAVFIAVPLAVRTADPGARVLLPGVLLVSGLAASMFSVWWLILRRSGEGPGPLGLFVERVASRDYVYLILVLTVLGKLHWFLWAAAFGIHIFNLVLWTLALRRPRRA